MLPGHPSLALRNRACNVNDRLIGAAAGHGTDGTTDIICGFPTETDEDFEKTIQVAEKSQYLHIHVFPYSPRPGTSAAYLKVNPTGAVRPGNARKERVAEMVQVGTEGFRRFLLSAQGRTILGRYGFSAP